MRSKNWCCKLSWPLIRKDLTRFWPVWIGYFITWTLILPIPLLNYGMESGRDLEDLRRLIVSSGELTALTMSLIFGGVSALAVWSHLYRQSSASMYHALPVTRETHFASHFIAGLTGLLVPNCLIAGACYLCQLGFGMIDPTLILRWLAIVCLECVLCYAIGTLAAQFTGSLAAMPVLYGLMNFAVAACEGLVNEFSTSLYFGVSSLRSRLMFLSPVVYLMEADPSTYVEELMVGGELVRLPNSTPAFDPAFFLPLGWYTLAAAVLTLCALALYRRRATETAGDVIAVSWLRPVAKYAFAVGCGLALGWVFEEIVFPYDTSWLTILLSCAAAAAIGYFAAVMLLQKSFRVWSVRAVAGFLPLLLALGLWVGAVELDLFRVEKYIPAVEEIATAELRADYELELTDPAELQQLLDLHAATLEAGEPDPLAVDERYNLIYYLKDGSVIERRYDVVCNEQALAAPGTPAALLGAIVNRTDHLMEAYLPPADAILEGGYVHIFVDSMTVNGQTDPVIEAQHLEQVREALEQDILAGKVGTWPQWATEKDAEVTFTVELRCRLPLETYPLENVEYKVAPDYRTRWFELRFGETGTNTQTLLTQLGYLK